MNDNANLRLLVNQYRDANHKAKEFRSSPYGPAAFAALHQLPT
jgi:hypothetical protein